MKVLTHPQKTAHHWSKEFFCSGYEKYQMGCKAKLEISLEDIELVFLMTYNGKPPQMRAHFTCPLCGAITDISENNATPWQFLTGRRPFCQKETSMNQQSNYPATYPTADLVVTIDQKEVVLICRAKEPFLNKLALPGGHVENEKCVQAAVREAREEINLSVDVRDVELLMLLDGPGRDPRPGHTLSLVYHVDLTSSDARIRHLRAASDAKQVVRKSLREICESDMAFDHWRVIQYVRSLPGFPG